MQSTNQVLQEQFKRLRQAQHRVSCDDESGHFLATIIDQLALVRRWVRRRYRRRAVVGPRRSVVSHQVQRVVQHAEGIEQSQTGRRKMPQGHTAGQTGRTDRWRTQRMSHGHGVTQRTRLPRTMHLVMTVVVVVVGRRRRRFHCHCWGTGRRVATVVTARIHTGIVHHYHLTHLQTRYDI
nr:unnamed protein product [Callosobruchus chinensis]